jgi:hypothetical protein
MGFFSRTKKRIQLLLLEMKMFRKLRTQPRIKGIKRLPKVAGLHPDVEYGLKAIARFEGKSVSWVQAEIISDFFGIDAATGKLIRVKKND